MQSKFCCAKDEETPFVLNTAHSLNLLILLNVVIVKKNKENMNVEFFMPFTLKKKFEVLKKKNKGYFLLPSSLLEIYVHYELMYVLKTI